MEGMGILIILLMFIAATIPKRRRRRRKKGRSILSILLEPTPEEEPITTIYPYRKTDLLTKTEYGFYKVLKEECDKRNFLICPKVRMEDFLDVTCKDEQLKYRGYIKSRHIDFIICNQDLKILCGIELDDPSHYTQKAQKTDTFKNDVFKEIGLPLYRIKTGHGSYKEQVEAAFYVMTQRELTEEAEKIEKDDI